MAGQGVVIAKKSTYHYPIISLLSIIYVIQEDYPETNIAPETGWLEDYFPFEMAFWQVLC